MYIEDLDIEAQVWRATHDLHNHHTSAVIKQLVVYGVLLLLPMVTVCSIISEYVTQSHELDALCDAVLTNRPAFCEGDTPSSIVDIVKHTFNSQHIKQCTEYFKCLRFGGDKPNIAVVISSTITKTFIIPIKELLNILSSIAYISQLLIVIGATITISLIIYSMFNYYTFNQIRSTASYRLARRRPSVLPNALK